ncbi:MAG TPA: hypothetical protein ENF69_08170 [Euryarchaeota archaeon]|nr:hypothetical protein [Euryarchaeota archaeon]
MHVSYDNIRDVNVPNLLKRSFKEIEQAQSLKHRFYTNDIVRYLKNKGVNDRELTVAEMALKDLERVFWAVEDTVGNEYRESSLRLYNEIVKVYSFLNFTEVLLQWNGHRGIFRKGPTTQEMIRRFRSSLVPLFQTTFDERLIRERIKRAKRDDEIVEIIVDFLKGRARNIKVYGEVAEILTGIAVNTKPFLYMRALESFGEDLERVEKEQFFLSTNIALLVSEQLKDMVRTKLLLEDTLSYIYGAIEVSTDEDSNFILDRARREEKKIRRILKRL